MTDCLIYNISVPQRHPSSICVELSRLVESLKGVSGLFSTVAQDEALMEFIGDFSRTDEIKPEDRTIGFVVVNVEKRKIAISISDPSGRLAPDVNAAAGRLRALGIETEVDLS